MTTGPTDFQSWALERQAAVERKLQALLPSGEILPQRLHSAMRYAVLGGGKRVRPLLAFAGGELGGAEHDRVLIVGCAIELIHAYSLVHDDLPCMDDDVLRRGKPTCHVEYDEATALLVGDALQSLAFQIMAEHRVAGDPERQLDMIRVFAQACGSRGMAGGQAIDLDSIGRTLSVPELELMHIHKTGALIRAAAVLGARCADTLDDGERARLDHFAKSIGLAFQVVDDVLDAEATTATLGKTAGKDAEQDKPTYVSVLGTARAKELARDLLAQALGALEGFGDRALRLRQLADFIVMRKF